MRHEQIINLSFNDLCAWQDYLNGKGEGTLNTVKTFTASFGDCGEGKVEVNIKVCDGQGNPFVDAVILFDGNDSGALATRETLAGEYSFYNPNGFEHTYVVIIPDTIEAAKEGQKKYREVEKWLQLLDDNHLKAIDFGLKTNTRMENERDYTIESILEICADDDNILDSYYEESQGNCSRLKFVADNKNPQCFPKTDLARVVITMDQRSDRECPSCQSEGIHLNDPKLLHNRTVMSLSGYCEDCGCDFRFMYILRLDDIGIANSRGSYSM